MWNWHKPTWLLLPCKVSCNAVGHLSCVSGSRIALVTHHKPDCMQVYEPIDYLHLLGEDPILPQGGGAKLYVASGDSSQGVLLLLRQPFSACSLSFA